jgi:hypothetical protein
MKVCGEYLARHTKSSTVYGPFLSRDQAYCVTAPLLQRNLLFQRKGSFYKKASQPSIFKHPIP